MKYGLIALILIVVVFVGYKIVASPHEMDDQQVLEKYTWTLKTDGKANGSAEFSKDYIKTQGHKYHYQLDDNDNMKIKEGPYQGTYSLSDEDVDYVLNNNKKDATPQKIKLERND
ncbi:hypothetical protein JOC36_001188 [Weissella uvarum]|uniref:hypothetical protein n=1 Tax=Weissella uvarum TaxID=1479233 RepID=UPI0019617501|nr:hypothetical protein [Weissella uvarum]MBM7617626.1 hypothetical protein [Weissella uvarum]MCM0595976.1 hypothetical protein [Weissella uvarum]